MKVGRVVGTAVLGLFLFEFIAIDLVLFGVIALDSVVVSLMPLIASQPSAPTIATTGMPNFKYLFTTLAP